MTVTVEIKQEHYLNDTQKKIKQAIMENLLTSMFNPIDQNKELFDGQSIADIIISCLLMFNREVLCHFFMNSNSMPIRLKVMRHFLKILKNKYNLKLLLYKKNH